MYVGLWHKGLLNELKNIATAFPDQQIIIKIKTNPNKKHIKVPHNKF